MEHLKPAHTFSEDNIEQIKTEREVKTPDSDTNDSAVQFTAAENQCTRAGRRVLFPDRLQVGLD